MAIPGFIARLMGKGEAGYDALQKKDDDFGAADIQHLKDQAPQESLSGQESSEIEEVAERMFVAFRHVPLSERNVREVQLIFAQAAHKSKRLKTCLANRVGKYLDNERPRDQLVLAVYIATLRWSSVTEKSSRHEKG